MKFVLLLVAILMAGCTLAQEKAPGLPEVENIQDFYRTGVGFRAGLPIAALTVKHCCHFIQIWGW